MNSPPFYCKNLTSNFFQFPPQTYRLRLFRLAISILNSNVITYFHLICQLWRLISSPILNACFYYYLLCQAYTIFTQQVNHNSQCPSLTSYTHSHSMSHSQYPATKKYKATNGNEGKRTKEKAGNTRLCRRPFRFITKRLLALSCASCISLRYFIYNSFSTNPSQLLSTPSFPGHYAITRTR